MSRELFRISKSLSYFIWLIGTIIILFLLSFQYKSKMEFQKDYWTHPITIYKDVEEIPIKIENVKLELTSLDVTSSNYQDEKRELEETILIYEFLYINKVNYKDVSETASYLPYTNDSTAFFMNITGVLLFSGVSLIIILSTMLINYEYSTGIYKFIYGQGVKRIKILKDKILVSLIVISASLTSVLFFSLILKLPYDTSYSYILLFVGERVKLISVETYMLYIILSFLSVMLFYSILYFSISLLVKNIFALLSLDVLFLVIFQTGFLSTENLILNSFSQFPIYVFDLGISIKMFIVVTFFKFLSVILLFVYSIIKFCRKDLI